jgi:D-glycero-alpha-D-manno-heptose-7-phosphate kinase
MDTCAVTKTHVQRDRTPQRRVVASAPMRISFAGGGTDVPPFVPGVSGRVVGSAINLRVRAIVEPFDRGWVRFEVPVVDETTTRSIHDPPSKSISFRLLEAALAHTGVTDGVHVRIETDIAPGAGLGGSAATSVAALTALKWSVGETATPEEVVHEATTIERERLSLVCGSQDQVFAACGGLLDLSFAESGWTNMTRFPHDRSFVNAFEEGLLLIDTLKRRVSGEVLERVDASAALGSVEALVSSAAEAARAIEEGSLARLLAAMRRSALAKLRRDPRASSAAVEIGRRLEGTNVEVIRACGAGNGGHVLLWAFPDKHDAILRALHPVTVRRPGIAANGVCIETA